MCSIGGGALFERSKPEFRHRSKISALCPQRSTPNADDFFRTLLHVKPFRLIVHLVEFLHIFADLELLRVDANYSWRALSVHNLRVKQIDLAFHPKVHWAICIGFR